MSLSSLESWPSILKLLGTRGSPESQTFKVIWYQCLGVSGKVLNFVWLWYMYGSHALFANVTNSTTRHHGSPLAWHSLSILIFIGHQLWSLIMWYWSDMDLDNVLHDDTDVYSRQVLQQWVAWGFVVCNPHVCPCLSCCLPNSARAQYQAHTCILDIFIMQDNKSCIVVWSTMHPLGPCLPKPPLISDHNIYPLTPPPSVHATHCTSPSSFLPNRCLCQRVAKTSNFAQNPGFCQDASKSCNLVLRSYNLILNPRQHLKAWAVFKGQGYNPLTGILDHKIMQSWSYGCARKLLITYLLKSNFDYIVILSFTSILLLA